MSREPVILAMVPCLDVSRANPASRATIIEAMWDVRDVPFFPTTLDRFKVYIAVTEIHAPIEFRLELTPADESAPTLYMLAKTNAPVDGPLGAKELVADLTGWPVPTPGVWILNLVWEGKILASRRMTWNQDAIRGNK